jgi:hypothetical protein
MIKLLVTSGKGLLLLAIVKIVELNHSKSIDP